MYCTTRLPILLYQNINWKETISYKQAGKTTSWIEEARRSNLDRDQGQCHAMNKDEEACRLDTLIIRSSISCNLQTGFQTWLGHRSCQGLPLNYSNPRKNIIKLLIRITT